MIYLVQRLILNQYAWTKPSPGRIGAAGEGDYVKENGFGHEDWNFNYELAIADHIFGYAYYEPISDKKAELFQFVFATYQSSRWYLAGFYLDTTFAPDGPPRQQSSKGEGAPSLGAESTEQSRKTVVEPDRS